MIFQIGETLVYCDGSCIGNPGRGGWAFLVNDQNFIHGGNELNTTNNKMELTAVYKALEYLIIHKRQNIQIFTDSMYLKNGITIWCKKWQKNNWNLSNKEPVKNQELWKKIISLESELQISWNWIRGHNLQNYINTDMKYHAEKHDQVDQYAYTLATSAIK